MNADQPIIERMRAELDGFSPELRRAARYLVDHPAEIGVHSMRQVAAAAGVKPNTLVRLARALGYGGYERLREPFREALRRGGGRFEDRAEWLQAVARGGRHGKLCARMAADLLANVQSLFSGTGAREFKAAADCIAGSRTTYVVGVGSAYAAAHNFTYLARMAVDNVVAVPRAGGLPIDDLSRIGTADALVAISVEPYRSETVEVTRHAHAQGARVVAVTDSLASPLARVADHALIAPTATPQFFPSMVAVTAALETLVAFIVAAAGRQVIANIERYHQRRFELGVYWDEPARRRAGAGARGPR